MAELILAADTSLKEAIDSMREEYTADTGDTLKAIYDDSSYMAADIIAGKISPDVVIPAAMYPVEDLIAVDKVKPALVQPFLSNRLVLIQKVGSAFSNITSFKYLNEQNFDPSKAKIYIANPDEPVNIPAGRYTHTVFDYDGNWDFVNGNAQKLNNTVDVLNAVATSTGPAVGIVYFSDAISRPDEVSIIGLAPEFINKQIVYPIARLNGGKTLTATKFTYHVTTIGIHHFRRLGFVEAVTGATVNC